MKNVRIPTVLAVVFALCAAVLCNKLLLKHQTGSSESSWFDAGCSDTNEDGTLAGCGAVLASPYSVWPPKKEDEPPDTAHVPVAFLGLVYYSTIAIWLIGVGSPSRDRRWVHLFPLLLVGAGLAGSIFFVYIMSTKLGEWCPWCMATHVLNLLMAVCIVLMWPRRGAVKKPVTEGDPSKAANILPHPSLRLAFITVLAIIFVAKAEDQTAAKRRFMQVSSSNKQAFDQCKDAFLQLRRKVSEGKNPWLSAKHVHVPVDEDDPVRLMRTDATNPMELIVFSDFECPGCKRLAGFLETAVAKLFDHNLKLVFKHYPLNADCNPQTRTKKHRFACLGAKMAEASRVIGGDAAFWKVHDYLFKHQDQLRRGLLSVEAVADEAGLDAASLRSTMNSANVIEHIQKNTEQAHSAGIKGTPSLYMLGRYVDPVIREEITFWDRIAEGYWKSRQVSRPESTKIPTTAPTPGTQDRTGDP